MRKLILLILSCLPVLAMGQDISVISKPLAISATFDKGTSVLSVNYRATKDFPVLIWVGDFNMAAIINNHDVSGSYLASLVTNEFYLIKKALEIEKFSEGGYQRANLQEEQRLNNYLFLSKDESYTLQLPISDPELVKRITKGEFELKGAVTVVNYSALVAYAMNKQALKSDEEKLMHDMASSEYFHNTYLTTLPDVKWQFDRKPGPKPTTHLPIQLPVTAKQTAESMIKNPVQRDSGVFSSRVVWELFCTKMLFDTDVKVK